VFTETFDTFIENSDDNVKDILKSELLARTVEIKDEFKNDKA
jgi:hypothetical protein